MKEKVLIAGVEYKKPIRSSKDTLSFSIEDIVEEINELILTCGGEPAGSIICTLQKPTPAFLIGEGKVQEIFDYCQENPVDVIIFSADLKGSQQRNLEERLNVKVIDRTQLILDIFARRATSSEGKMQVELAQLEYLLPRLVGKRTELSRLGGGIGTVGPGETKLETDRRRITDRITKLKRNLEEVASDRKTKRKKRQDQQVPGISLVGYTNAGKSTLLNTLTDAGQLTQNALFTTLDSLSRQLTLANRQKVIISDTVGFMHELPHHLIEAFKATLEEVKDADLLLHVVDVSHPNFRKYILAVDQVLIELDAQEKPTLLVFNKIDKLADKSLIEDLKKSFENSIFISALEKENIDILLEKISEALEAGFVEIDVKLPLNKMDVVNLIHKNGQVHTIKYGAKSVHIVATVTVKLANQLDLN